MSRLLKSLHSTTQGLHECGLIKPTTMREFTELYGLAVDELSPQEIKAIRKRAGVSQPVFARYLNASLSSVQKWERGIRRPDGPALKLLHLVRKQGLQILAD